MKSYLYLAFFFMVMTYLTPKEQDMRFAELTKKIEGISYEYDADTTDLFTAFEAEEN